jgi:hypothetical protein
VFPVGLRLLSIWSLLAVVVVVGAATVLVLVAAVVVDSVLAQEPSHRQ